MSKTKVTGDEKVLVQKIHDASGKLLAAKGYAEVYLCRILFIQTLTELDAWIEKGDINSNGS